MAAYTNTTPLGVTASGLFGFALTRGVAPVRTSLLTTEMVALLDAIGRQEVAVRR